ncbi:MAG: hypothetical protein ABI881_15415, partial [Betaproteobacteria bacterium]
MQHRASLWDDTRSVGAIAAHARQAFIVRQQTRCRLAIESQIVGTSLNSGGTSGVVSCCCQHSWLLPAFAAVVGSR